MGTVQLVWGQVNGAACRTSQWSGPVGVWIILKLPHYFILSIVEFPRFLLTLASRKLGGEDISHRAGEV